MSSITQSEKSLNSMDRYRFLMVLNAGNICQEYQFVKEVECSGWQIIRVISLLNITRHYPMRNLICKTRHLTSLSRS